MGGNMGNMGLVGTLYLPIILDVNTIVSSQCTFSKSDSDFNILVLFF